MMFSYLFCSKDFSSLWKEKTTFLLVQVFSEKPKSLEGVSFHHNIFSFSSFGLDLSVCIVNAMIFINKYLVISVRIIFNNLLKSTTIMFLFVVVVKLTNSYAICDV